MICKGTIEERIFGAGSKSEHRAIMLVTDTDAYRLRREAGNPFADKTLQGLVGRTVQCEGHLHDGTFIMSKWEELPGT